ncbi:hypothetical protein [Bacillus pumilus]|uniref:hypothetical protein n=1 Tax=Bacillus pumilus TaxID=1408 RepID=UPI000D03EBC4|nr:hypothetical protein [Bacillus pumilus]PRS29850.1 hypothetical protein C6X99_01530 [Bacillus pumilus]
MKKPIERFVQDLKKYKEIKDINFYNYEYVYVLGDSKIITNYDFRKIEPLICHIWFIKKDAGHELNEEDIKDIINKVMPLCKSKAEKRFEHVKNPLEGILKAYSTYEADIKELFSNDDELRKTISDYPSI